MKTLYLARHAKSSWDHVDLKDFERPLNERGAVDAPAMGRVLKSMAVLPDLIVSSPALRATTTAMTIAEGIGYPGNVEINVRLYQSYTAGLWKLVKSLPDVYASVMLIGHNPSFTYFVNELIPDEIENIPTCGTVAIQFPVSEWKQVGRKSGRLVFFEYPKKNK